MTTAHSRFDGIRDVMRAHDIEHLSGALFDLGVSSPQLDQGDRGFSYRNDGPIDMRMDRTQPWSATDVVNGYDEVELARVIRRYGDERFANRIARAIVAARPIETTAELAGIVSAAIPAAARRTGGHPAKRTFQAIRIEVNNELDVLPGAIDQAIEATVPTGRIAVLTYHSGEDRIVKERFRVAEGDCDVPAGPPVRVRRDPARSPGPGAPHAHELTSPKRTRAPGRPGCASSRRSHDEKWSAHERDADASHRRPAPQGDPRWCPIRPYPPAPDGRAATVTPGWPKLPPSSSSGRPSRSCRGAGWPPTRRR